MSDSKSTNEYPVESPAPYQVSAFYKFIPLEHASLESLKTTLEEKAKSLKVKGLFLLGTEGANATICGLPENVTAFKDFLIQTFGEMDFKDSVCSFIPFRAFKLKIKPEIVTLGDTTVVPQTSHWNHITPEEWEFILKNDPDAVVIDTRNWYETQIGKFKSALDLNMNEFSEFPDKVKSLDLPKDKKVLIYCTGGIRCEKAILEMQKQGFEKVYQLEGGILKYLEDVKSDEWDGECFVFDRRVAVDKDLQPSTTYTFCPHCGQPALQLMECIRCHKPGRVCHACLSSNKPEFQTCSKNCAHHHMRGSRVKTMNQGPSRQELHKQVVSQNDTTNLFSKKISSTAE